MSVKRYILKLLKWRQFSKKAYYNVEGGGGNPKLLRRVIVTPEQMLFKFSSKIL